MCTPPKRFSRRLLLSRGLAGVSSLATLGALRPHFAYGVGPTAPKRGRSLVVIIKDGGEDVTFSQPPLTPIAAELAKVRPTIHVPTTTVLDWLDGSTGLHPNYAPLRPIIDKNNFKIIQGCGFPSHSGSHQDAQNHFSHAARHLTGQRATQGWPARLKDFYSLAMYQVAGFNTGQRLDLQSTEPCLVVSNFGSYRPLDRNTPLGGAPLSEMTREVLDDMLMQFPAQFPAESANRAGLKSMFESVSTVQSINTVSVGAAYPTVGIGADLGRLARMMRWRQQNNPQENAIYLVRAGGYDTHSDQVASLGGLIDREAKGLVALHEDLQAWNLWNSTTILLVSEFSRTLRENNGNGTDHARGTTISLMGGGIRGGGSKSVVSAPILVNDIQRNHQTPVHYYREVIREVLEWWGVSSNDMASILPEVAPQSQSFSLYA
jgi:uncharacterized protein (DUF1501 family)